MTNASAASSSTTTTLMLEAAHFEDEPECAVFYELMPDPATSWYAIIPFAVVYITIFVLGIAGNSAVIYVTLKHRTLQTVQNMFILNLAASDLIVCLLSLPITPVTNIFKNWFFGPLLCRLIPWVQGVSIFICTFSLGAIAVDRYILVVMPHSPPLRRRGALIVTVILWSLSVIVTLPYAVFMYVEDYEGICGCFCTEKWPNASSRRAYTMVVMCAQFVVPFVLMAFCYASIFARLRTRAMVRLKKLDARSHALENSSFYAPHTTCIPTTSHAVANHCDTSNDNGTGDDKQNGISEQTASLLDRQERGRAKLLSQTRRTTSILLSMVVIFGLTWLPHNVVSLIIEYDDTRTFFHLWGREDLDLSYLVNLFTHSIAMTNNISNPVLYAWLNPTFRQLVIETCFGRRRAALAAQKRAALLAAERREQSRRNHSPSPFCSPPPPPQSLSGAAASGAGANGSVSFMHTPVLPATASKVIASKDSDTVCANIAYEEGSDGEKSGPPTTQEESAASLQTEQASSPSESKQSIDDENEELDEVARRDISHLHMLIDLSDTDTFV